jgi:regulatory protein
VTDADGGAKALAFLVRSAGQRPLTTAEARKKLLARDHSEPVVDAAIARAVSARVLDDAAFARAWVDDRGINRGYGRDRLVREMRRRLLEEETIAAALAALDEVDEVAQATELARVRALRMRADEDPRAVAGKLAGFLLRRGFTSDVAHQVAREVTALDSHWD